MTVKVIDKEQDKQCDCEAGPEAGEKRMTSSRAIITMIGGILQPILTAAQYGIYFIHRALAVK